MMVPALHGGGLSMLQVGVSAEYAFVTPCFHCGSFYLCDLFLYSAHSVLSRAESLPSSISVNVPLETTTSRPSLAPVKDQSPPTLCSSSSSSY